MDPKNHDEVAQIASKVTKAPPERFGWLFTKQDYYRSPDMLPNLEYVPAGVTEIMKKQQQGWAYIRP